MITFHEGPGTGIAGSRRACHAGARPGKTRARAPGGVEDAGNLSDVRPGREPGESHGLSKKVFS